MVSQPSSIWIWTVPETNDAELCVGAQGLSPPWFSLTARARTQCYALPDVRYSAPCIEL